MSSCEGTSGEVFRKLAEQKENRIERASDARSCAHVICDPAEVCGVAGGGVHQGQERDHLARVYGRAGAELRRAAFLGRGYFVSTVGRDEELVREYIRNQEEEDERLDQMNLWR